MFNATIDDTNFGGETLHSLASNIFEYFDGEVSQIQRFLEKLYCNGNCAGSKEFGRLIDLLDEFLTEHEQDMEDEYRYQQGATVGICL